MMYADDDELEIHPEEEVQVNISTQRSETMPTIEAKKIPLPLAEN